jgi:hypothetical protein
MENLKKLNQIRRIARGILHEGFQREYQAIVSPIIDKYKRNIVHDQEMLFEIKEAISKIEQIARNYQYVPNIARTGKKREPKAFDYHSKLYELEITCQKLY